MQTVHLERFISASSLYESKLLKLRSWSYQASPVQSCKVQMNSHSSKSQEFKVAKFK